MASLPTFRGEVEEGPPIEVVTLAAPGASVDEGHWAAMAKHVDGKAYTWEFQQDAFTFDYHADTQLTYFSLRLRDKENIAK